MNTNKKTKQSGAVLLIAILVSSVVLAVGFGIYQRTYKQLLLGSFWKQIQIAFSAADAGLECAVYWDKQYPYPSGSEPALCFGTPFTWNVSLPNYSSKTLEQTSSYPGQDERLTVQGGCVELRVIKVSDTAVVGGKWTYIEAAGYNDACDSTSPRRVNRIRWIKYKG